MSREQSRSVGAELLHDHLRWKNWKKSSTYGPVKNHPHAEATVFAPFNVRVLHCHTRRHFFIYFLFYSVYPTLLHTTIMPAPKTTKGVPPGTVRGRYKLKTVIAISKTTGRKVRSKRWVLTDTQFSFIEEFREQQQHGHRRLQSRRLGRPRRHLPREARDG